MNRHLPAGPGRAGALGLHAGAARRQGLGRADRVEAARIRSALRPRRDTGRRARRSRPQESCSCRSAAERALCWSGTRQENRTKRLEQVRTTVEGEATLTKPRIDAPILDQAPTANQLTDYDRLHLITYIRLLDADADGIPWEEASRSILHIDPETELERARRAHQSHLARAQWMTRVGYRHILTDEKLRKSGDSR